ncbi:MAG: DUF6544 family protein [Vicinamibacterales bacterium]
MRLAFASLLVVHALIHLMGVVKAFELAPLEQLKLPVSPAAGVLWLLAAVLLMIAAIGGLVPARWFWLAGLLAVVVSQAVIISAWSDARAGTLPNLVLAALVVYAACAWGPFGLRAEYERLVRQAMSESVQRDNALVPDAAALPVPLQVRRYLEFTGVPGTPPLHAIRVRMTGRIRASATADWMPFTAEQHSFFDPPRRYFWMTATRSGLPIDGLHVYNANDASMRIRLLSLFPVVTLGGPEMMRTETVTVLNDMCIMAPARLLDPAIRWRELDARSVEATYSNAGHVVHAVLVFNDEGALDNFWSDDRPALAEDGKTLIPQRWSTPVGDYRAMPPYRLASRGEARYAAARGEYAYIEFSGIEVSALAN